MENTSMPAAPAPESADQSLSKDAKMFGMLAHLTALCGFVIPFGNIIGPLVVWLLKKNEMAFVDEQGKEALNFQITVSIGVIICVPLTLIVIGAPLMVLLGLADLIFAIIAAIKANDGFHYKYPFALRLIK